MKTLSSFIAVIFITITAMGQPGPQAEQYMRRNNSGSKHGIGIPGLTDEQSKKIQTLKLNFQKEMLGLKNLMVELRAKQRTLETNDKVDMKAINSNIDEITKLQNQMMKKGAEHRQQIRSILTDEQRLWFDTKVNNGTKGFKKNRMHMRMNECNATCNKALEK